MENEENKTGFWKMMNQNKFQFFISFFIVLLVSFAVLYLVGLVPESFKVMIGREPVKESAENRSGELPISVKIESVGIDSYIYNPSTTSVVVLNDYLLKGAVRYPGSGLLGGNGNIFIFGHSTGFGIVNNQAYKTFNHLQNLKEGDLIHIYSDKNDYTYKVTSVKLVNAEKTLVEFDYKSKKLTLSTCDNFGEKTDRYVVEAEFVSKSIIKQK